MAKQDYYATLGVAREASAEDLKKAYRKLAMQYPSGPQSGRQAGGGQVQGSERGLRHPEGRAEARRLRPLRPRGVRTGRRRAAVAGGFDFSAGGGLGRHLRPDVRRVHGRARRRRTGRSRRGDDIRQAVEIDLDRGLRRHQGQPARAHARSLRGVQRHRRRRTRPRSRRHLRHLPWRRQGARAAGLLPDRAHLPDLRRPGPGDPEPLQGLRTAPARCSASARLSGERSRPASRTARASAWPARARPAARARQRATSMSHVAIRPHDDLPARRRQHLHARAAAHDPGGAGRRRRGAGDRWQQGQGEDPRRAPRPAISSACAARDSPSCAARRAATCTSRSRSRRRRTCPRRQRELLEEFEARGEKAWQRQPGKRGLLRQGEGVLRAARRPLTPPRPPDQADATPAVAALDAPLERAPASTLTCNRRIPPAAAQAGGRRRRSHPRRRPPPSRKPGLAAGLLFAPRPGTLALA